MIVAPRRTEASITISRLSAPARLGSRPRSRPPSRARRSRSIGHGTIGGTCVNIGCVPSKTLIRAAETLHQASAAKRFAGISARARADDWSALVHQKDELVAGLRQSKYVDLLPAYNSISYMEGQARLAEGGVALNGDLIKAERLIITTGARPAVPALPGIEDVDYLTSTSALALETLPKSLLVIGGGFVGAELAQMFARMGVKVTIVCRSHLVADGRARDRGGVVEVSSRRRYSA